MERVDANLVPFAQNNPSGYRFAFGTDTATDDINVNYNDNIKKGWGTTPNEFPEVEDFNAMVYTIGYLLSYLYHMGIAEWNDKQKYRRYSRVIGSDGIIYKAKTGTDISPNINNNPTTDTTNWEMDNQFNINSLDNKITPIDTDNFVIQEMGGLFKKLSWANLKATLATLFAVKDSPSFTGTPTAPTQTAQDNSTKVATTAYVDGKMALGTAVNAIGTSIDFIGIPSWAKRITLMMKDVSLSGTSSILVQVGKTTIQTTGYNSSSAQGSSGTFPIAIGSFNGFVIANDVATDGRSYTMEINKISASSYVASYCGGGTTGRTVFSVGGGSVSLSDILDRLRITTVNGTDAFDAGQINIIYEG